jgi:hypothetical protein
MQEDQSLLPLDARKGRTAAAIVSILREERVNHGTFCDMARVKQQFSLHLAF